MLSREGWFVFVTLIARLWLDCVLRDLLALGNFKAAKVQRDSMRSQANLVDSSRPFFH